MTQGAPEMLLGELACKVLPRPTAAAGTPVGLQAPDGTPPVL